MTACQCPVVIRQDWNHGSAFFTGWSCQDCGHDFIRLPDDGWFRRWRKERALRRELDKL